MDWDFVPGSSSNSEDPCITVDMSTFEGSEIVTYLFTNQPCGATNSSTIIPVSQECPCDISYDPEPFKFVVEDNQVLVKSLLDVFAENSTLIWDFGDGTTITNQDIVQYSYAETGTYTIALTVLAMGENGDCCSEKFMKEVTINKVAGECQIENLSFTYEFLDEATVAFTSHINLAPGSNLQGVLWKFGDGASSSELNPIHTYLNTGQYYTVTLIVEAHSINGEVCRKKYVKRIQVGDIETNASSSRLSKNQEQQAPSNFNVFPNPSIGKWQLLSDNTMDEEVLVRIIDIHGKVILSEKIETIEKGIVKTYENKELNTGVYMVNISVHGNIIENHKLLIQKE